MTAVAEREAETAPAPEDQDPKTPIASIKGWWLGIAVLAIWVGLAVAFHGKNTLTIGGADQIGVQNWLADRASDIALAGSDNWFISITQGISDVLDSVIQWFQLLISAPDFPNPYPTIGFWGVLAIAWFVTALIAGWRMSVLTAVCFLLFGMLGYYEDAMDLLIVTMVAVALSTAIGHPTGRLDGAQLPGTGRAHADPRRDADAAVVHLPAAADAALRHRRLRRRGLHARLLAATGDQDRRTRVATSAHSDHGGRHLHGTDQVATVVQDRAADGQGDHHRGCQPDHDGRALDGHDRRLHQRSRPRAARRTRPERTACGRRVRARSVHRADGDHAGPRHHGSERELRAAGPWRGQEGRQEPGHLPAVRSDRDRGHRLPLPHGRLLRSSACRQAR